MLICHIFCHVTVFAGVENLPSNTKADWKGHQERGGVVGRNQNSFNALYKKWVAKETEQHTLRGYKPTQGRIKQPNECPQPSLYSIKSPYKLPWQILSAFFISKGDDAWHVLNAWMGEGGERRREEGHRESGHYCGFTSWLFLHITLSACLDWMRWEEWNIKFLTKEIVMLDGWMYMYSEPFFCTFNLFYLRCLVL